MTSQFVERLERQSSLDSLDQCFPFQVLSVEASVLEFYDFYGIGSLMGANFGSGLHAAAGRPVDTSAYGRYLGRWPRLFVPAVLAAAEVADGYRVLDVATGPGEASLVALSVVKQAGLVIGADISPAMLEASRIRLASGSFRPW